MNKNIAIRFENISKQYRLGTIGTGTISHDLNRWWHTVRGKEDPYLTVGQENDRAATANGDYVWALKDITFDVEKGDVIGIIGKNGAGKSTLLKILSRITRPTTGDIKAHGRVASLLEVGTGFHPEMTGRENIYLNGAIMGMSKDEINKKLDEIVNFAGVEKYIDTPSKRYSSGMIVRLGFAIAAHLEPEILVVDEVLAVGDAEFQKKAIGKMQDVSRGGGRTVLFVSHNMASIKKLCNKGVLLANGKVEYSGEIDDVINRYINTDSQISSYSASEDDNKEVQILRADIQNIHGTSIAEFSHEDDIIISFTIKNDTNQQGVRCNVSLWTLDDQLIMVDRIELEQNSKYQSYTGVIKNNIFTPGMFKIMLAVDIPGVKVFEMLPDYLSFNTIDLGSEIGKFGDKQNGLILPVFKWNKK